MAAPKQPSGRDDDTWGRLASELLGINLGGGDDLDLSDLEPPPPPVPPAPPKIETPPPAVAKERVEIDLADMDFEADEREIDEVDSADDTDFEEDFDDVADEVAAELNSTDVEESDIDDDEDEEPPAEISEAAPESKDDFWDALESWDWETASEEAAALGDASTDRPRPSGDRGRRGDRGRDRSGGSGRDRSSRDDRPPRQESDRPRRSERPATERPAAERPSAERQERRPEPRGERPVRSDRPSESRPERASRRETPVDEFGAGVVEDTNAGEFKDWDQPELVPARPARPEPRRSVPETRKGDDDFADDLLDEEDLDEVSEDVSSKEESSEESDRPRRRRRRRRRRSTGDRAPQAALSPLDDESLGPAEAVADEEDLEAPEPEREPADEERREPRGRRRRRRRPGDRNVRSEVRDEPPKPLDADDTELDEEFAVEEQPVVAMSYEDVPTWEEAISYLLKPVGDSRRDGGYRSGPPRRR